MRAIRQISYQSLLLAALCCAPAGAVELTAVNVSPAGLEWQTTADQGKMILTVSGPESLYLRQEFKAGNRPVFGMVNEAGKAIPDGEYAWELRPAIRLFGVPQVQRGYFLVQDGVVVQPSIREEPVENLKPAKARGGLQRTFEKDQLIPDDLVVWGSACVGVFCANPETFGTENLKVKNQVVRLLFEDTSTSAGFPATDWRLTANDASGSSGNHFSIEDATAGTVPFTVRGGAPTDALVVTSSGKIGFGTTIPYLDLHVNSGANPGIRFEQNASLGNNPITWDVVGNDLHFLVQSTPGGQWPFRILASPNTVTNTLVIGTNSRVGIGTDTPDATLDLEKTTSVEMRLTVPGGNTWRMVNDSNGFGILRTGTLFRTFTLDTAGNLTILGTLTQGSSRDIKSDFIALDPREALERVTALPITQWSYKADGPAVRHLGPMAEDFHQAFGLGQDDKHIAPGDQAGVALLALQGLNQVVQEKDREIAELKNRIETLEKVVHALAEAKPEP